MLLYNKNSIDIDAEREAIAIANSNRIKQTIRHNSKTRQHKNYRSEYNKSIFDKLFRN